MNQDDLPIGTGVDKPPLKKTRWGVVLIGAGVVALVVVAIGLVIFSIVRSGSSTTPPAAPTTTHIYEVSCDPEKRAVYEEPPKFCGSQE